MEAAGVGPPQSLNSRTISRTRWAQSAGNDRKPRCRYKTGTGDPPASATHEHRRAPGRQCRPTFSAPHRGRAGVPCTSQVRSRMPRVPLVMSLGLVALALLGPAREIPALVRTLIGAAIALGAWNAVLVASARHAGRTLALEVVLRKQHYLQACAQGSVLLYWGWYWRAGLRLGPPHRWPTALRLCVRHAARMVAARHLHAWASAPFPSSSASTCFSGSSRTGSTCSSCMVALGFAAKELIRWDKDGRRAHIFNPSSFPLAVVLAGADSDGHERPHVGPGDREHAVLSARTCI